MNQESSILKIDENDFKVTRYMNLAKFLSFITTSKLYFSGLEKLKEVDPYECELNQNDINNIIESYIKDNEFSCYDSHDLRSNLINTERDMRRNIVIQSIAVNCWCKDECDSPAMWKQYAESDEYGIAITTMYSKLLYFMQITNRRFDIKLIDYKNPSVENMLENPSIFKNLLDTYLQQKKHYEKASQSPNYNIYNDKTFWELTSNLQDLGLYFYSPLIFSKHKGYEYEQELRIATIITNNDCWKENNESLDYLNIQIDLDYLIDKIFISPNAPFWFKETIENLTRRFNLNKEVCQSDLLSPPVCY